MIPTKNILFQTMKETLLPHNRLYDREHSLSDSDAVKVATIALAIEKERKTFHPTPQPGDSVLFTNRFGVVYPNAYLENSMMSDGMLSICEQPYIPFTDINSSGQVSFRASGGSWSAIYETDIPNFIYQKDELRKFCTWGHSGPRANGALDFHAIVARWEFTQTPYKKTE